jgi:UDP-N-acetylmuramate dehydrogenase
VLGGGSNLLVSDEGFDGLVLSVGLLGISLAPSQDSVLYSVAAGEPWDRVVQRSIEDNCAGLECLAGIPGTAGGTPVQNVGAYGQEVASTIERVRGFDLEEHCFREFARSECEFGYRRSRFNTRDKGRYVVTRVDYRLIPDGRPTLVYEELRKRLQADASLGAVAEAVRSIRQSKGMLLVDGDPDCRSAGSFFKNPIVDQARIEAIRAQAGQDPPCFPEAAGGVKLPAAWLIERAGFSRGYRRGAAAVSSRHTLALVNCGSARAADVLALAREIRDGVENRFAIRLEMEPVLVGFREPRLPQAG